MMQDSIHVDETPLRVLNTNESMPIEHEEPMLYGNLEAVQRTNDSLLKLLTMLNTRTNDVESLLKYTQLALKTLVGSLASKIHIILLDKECQSAIAELAKTSRDLTGKETILIREIELSDGSFGTMALLNANVEFNRPYPVNR